MVHIKLFLLQLGVIAPTHVFIPTIMTLMLFRLLLVLLELLLLTICHNRTEHVSARYVAFSEFLELSL